MVSRITERHEAGSLSPHMGLCPWRGPQCLLWMLHSGGSWDRNLSLGLPKCRSYRGASDSSVPVQFNPQGRDKASPRSQPGSCFSHATTMRSVQGRHAKRPNVQTSCWKQVWRSSIPGFLRSILPLAYRIGADCSGNQHNRILVSPMRLTEAQRQATAYTAHAYMSQLRSHIHIHAHRHLLWALEKIVSSLGRRA